MISTGKRLLLFRENAGLDASKKIPNEITEKLEPFYAADLIDFQAGSVSGFYADLQDDSDYTLRNIARRRAGDRFNKLLYDDLMAKECQTLKSNPTCSFERKKPMHFCLSGLWYLPMKVIPIRSW